LFLQSSPWNHPAHFSFLEVSRNECLLPSAEQKLRLLARSTRYFVTLTSNLGNYCRNDLTPKTAIYWLTANLMARFYRSIIKAELWEGIWAERKGNSLYLVVPSYRGQIGSLSKIF